jgi:hypothetical protein
MVLFSQGGTPMPDKDAPRCYGLVIAFLLPGFLTLWAISMIEPIARGWLGTAASADAKLGGFLFAVLASLGLGLLVSGIRFFLFDSVLLKLPLIGIPKAPEVDQRSRKEHEGAYQDARESHYCYFQFYANTAVALLIVAAIATIRHLALGGSMWGPAVWGGAILLVAFEVFLYFAARDCIRRYHQRVQSLIGLPSSPAPQRGIA